MASRSFCLAFFISFVSASFVAGAGFLRQGTSQAEVEKSLLKELAGTFRSSASKDHILSLEVALKPLYATVPKEKDGALSHSVVRYVLHRFFAQRGWFVRGLEPGSGKANAQNTSAGSNSLQDLQEWVPSYLQGFLEQLAGGKGISFRELAVLAATLEDLVHKETISRLEVALKSLEFQPSQALDAQQVDEALEVFMMIYMLGGNFTVTTPAGVRRAHQIFSKDVKDWAEVQEWMHDIRKKLYPGEAELNFESLSQVVEEVGLNYGTYNKKECASMKNELLEVESQKAGRVRLPDFYKKGLSGVFSFNEKKDYLRVLGALDESDPLEPSVIVSNYVAARPNCLVASSFYAICCQYECEDLMGKLENSVGSENGTPEQIATLVSAMSSDTVTAPRKMSPSLVKRLNGIADNYGGQVPLHGRLFAQWMHHAFPRECPFPHEGGANPQTADEWMAESGHETSKASNEEIMAHVNRLSESELPKGEAARKHHHFVENELPWSDSEDLLFSKPLVQRRNPLYGIAIFAMLGSLAYGLVFASRPLLSGAGMATPFSKGGGLGLPDFHKDSSHGKMA